MKAYSPIVHTFVPKHQLLLIDQLLGGEEGDFFLRRLQELTDIFTAMPVDGFTDGQGDDAIVHLHYFCGSFDWYIIEADTDVRQLCAFGYADMGCPELGSISIAELVATRGLELDFHFEPRPLREVKRERGE